MINTARSNLSSYCHYISRLPSSRQLWSPRVHRNSDIPAAIANRLISRKFSITSSLLQQESAAQDNSSEESKLKFTDLSAGTAKGTPENLEKLTQEISQLSLLEVSQLVTLLKEKLNINDSQMMMAAAPAMPQAMAQAEGNSTPAAAAEKEPEKKEFTVKLEKFTPATKAKLIKEIKGLLEGCNLVEAKKFVEAAPKVVKESVLKEEAERIKKLLESVGGTVSLE